MAKTSLMCFYGLLQCRPRW